MGGNWGRKNIYVSPSITSSSSANVKRIMSVIFLNINSCSCTRMYRGGVFGYRKDTLRKRLTLLREMFMTPRRRLVPRSSMSLFGPLLRARPPGRKRTQQISRTRLCFLPFPKVLSGTRGSRSLNEKGDLLIALYHYSKYLT